MCHSPLVLHFRRIYILPTKRGLGFVLLIALLLAIAAIYNNNLVYLLCFLLASLFFITIIHTVKSLTGLEIKAGYSPAVFLGEDSQNTLWLKNPHAEPRFNIQLSFSKIPEYSVDIKAYDSSRVLLKYPTTKRGWLTIPQPIISSQYPFGLFRAWTRLNIHFKTLVYPRPCTENNPLPENISTSENQGFAEQGQDDFYGLLRYQAGDSIRHIHWRTLAKGQGLYTKQYSGETRSSEIYIDYDTTVGADQEQRLSQMCRWVLDAHQSGIEYGFKLEHLSLAPNLSESHYQQCLVALAEC